MLFGGIQCHASIRVPPISALQSAPALARLRGWIAVMHRRFTDCDHLSSGQYFEPRVPAPRPATLFDRFVFWVGTLAMLVATPITVPLARHYLKRVRKLGLLPIPSAPPPTDKKGS